MSNIQSVHSIRDKIDRKSNELLRSDQYNLRWNSDWISKPVNRKYKAVLMNNLKVQPYKLLDEFTLNGENQSSDHYKRIFDHPVFGFNEVNTKIKRPVFSKKIKVSVQYSGNEDVTFKKQAKQHFRNREVKKLILEVKDEKVQIRMEEIVDST